MQHHESTTGSHAPHILHCSVYVTLVRAPPGLALVHHVGHEIILGRHRVPIRPPGHRQCRSEVEVFDGKVDDGRVFLHEKVVLLESLDMQQEKARQARELVALTPSADVVGDQLPVVLFQNLKDWNLRDDVLLQGVFVQRRGWQAHGQHQEWHPLCNVLGAL